MKIEAAIMDVEAQIRAKRRQADAAREAARLPGSDADRRRADRTMAAFYDTEAEALQLVLDVATGALRLSKELGQ